MASVLILDYGCCYSGVLVRVLRDLRVACVLEPVENCLAALDAGSYLGVVLCGGLDSVFDADALQLPKEFLDKCLAKKVKVLAISHGFYSLLKTLGGKLAAGDAPDYVVEPVAVESKNPLFGDVAQLKAFFNPKDKVVELPQGFSVVAKSLAGLVAAAHDACNGVYGVAFHPEANDTEHGHKLLENFCFQVCKCPKEWSMERYLQDEIKRVNDQCGADLHVVAGLSGGVDSSVCAAIVHQAIGKRFHGVMINTGLMRLDETKLCAERLVREIPGLHLVIRDSQKVFFEALKGVLDPEQKRKIIGKVYIDEFEAAIRDLGLEKSKTLLLQGTIYPDILESQLGRRSKLPIKSHHNVGGLPENLSLKLIEPVQLLFKEEVRKLGKLVGLSEETCQRQPFPGPGLGVRVIGELTPTSVDVVRRADAILNKILDERGYRPTISQSACVFLADVHSTGIRHSARSYGGVVVVRVIVTKDFVTAKWARHIDNETLACISREITDGVPEVTRVCYDITDKPPACIEWE